MLENHARLETNDPALVLESLPRMDGLKRRDIADKNVFFFRANEVQLNDLSLSLYSVADGAGYEFAEDEAVKQIICIDGACRLKIGDETRMLDCGRWSAIVPRLSRHSFVSLAHSRLLTLRIRNSALDRRLEALCGEKLTNELRFEASPNGSPDTMMAFRRTILDFAAEVLSGLEDRCAVTLQERQDALITNFLVAHRHNFSDAMARHQPGSPGYSKMKQVEEFIVSNSDQALTLEKLSHASEISIRSLFRHFKKWKGVTPLEFVKQVRLDRSRSMLQSSNGDTSVMAVALKCGFLSHGHFAREYRRRFSELPSETLDRFRKETAQS